MTKFTAAIQGLAESGAGQLRLPQPVQRCVPLLPLHPRIADQVDAQVKVVGLVPGPAVRDPIKSLER
jgi:hypothetical protein